MGESILTIPEVAELLRVAEKTVYSLAQKGALPAFKVGGQWRFSRNAIESWIAEQSRSAPQSGMAAPAFGSSSTSSSSGRSKHKPRRRR